jgi:hypothetical protein
MQVAGQLYVPDVKKGTVYDPSMVAAPGFQDAVAAEFGAIGRPSLTRDEAMYAIAERYDPRYMSFIERRDMMQELRDQGLISDQVAFAASFHPLFVPQLGAGTEDTNYAQLTIDTEAKARQNPWLDVKQNYVDIAQYELAQNGYTPQGRELLDVLWEISQIRDADPALAQQQVPEIRSGKDVAFTEGKGLSSEYVIPGTAGKSSEAGGTYDLDFTSMALQASGHKKKKQDEEKAAEEARAIAQAEAVARAAAEVHQARQDANTIATGEADEQRARTRLESVELPQAQATGPLANFRPTYV